MAETTTGAGSGAASSFDSADFFDCRDSEELRYTEPIEAIEAFLDDACTGPGCDMVALIASVAPLIVTAHDRRKVEAKWIESTARNLVGHFEEDFAEEFGGGDDPPEIPNHDARRALREMRSWIERRLEHLQPWQCERVAQRSYSAAEIEALMREHNPHWFEPAAEGVAP